MVKYLILVTFTVMWVSTSNADREFIVQCLEEVGLADRISQLANLDLKEAQCFAKCMFTKTGQIDADGNVNMDKVNEITERMKVGDSKKDNLKKCFADVKKIQKCEDTKTIIECMDGVFKS